VIGVLMALRHREVNGGQGQMIDVALYESVFNVMESLLPEYDAFGAVRGAAGSALPGIAPSNAYRCAGGAYVLVAGNGDSIFRRLMQAIGRADLAEDPALARNDGRVVRVGEIDAAIEAWTAARPIDQVIATLEAAAVPVGRIYTVADIAADPQYLARDMIVQTRDADGRPLKVPGIVPKLGATPGRLRTPAPRLGEHNRRVLGQSGWPARAANDDNAS
jgi:crotonobetainyl-CoA:carnitine CoA-transferase CaiB-like acyl-CoA transferase